jgi:hypothetical protein
MSWRDRWVKKLALQPRPSSVKQEGEPELEQRSPGAASGIIKQAKSPGSRVRFSAEDDRLLRSYVTEAAAAGRRIKGNKIYEELAEQVSHCIPRITTTVCLTTDAVPAS